MPALRAAVFPGGSQTSPAPQRSTTPGAAAVAARNPTNFRVSYAISREQTKADGSGGKALTQRQAELNEWLARVLDNTRFAQGSGPPELGGSVAFPTTEKKSMSSCVSVEMGCVFAVRITHQTVCAWRNVRRQS